MTQCVRTVFFSLCFLIQPLAQGQIPEWCYSPTKSKMCDFYSECIEKVHSCKDGPDDYAIGFAKKYCLEFNKAKFSPVGEVWRDETMVCLQRALVPLLDQENVSCRGIRKIGFESHVPCYTDVEPSFCDLSSKDLRRVRHILQKPELLNRETINAGIRIGKICLQRRQIPILEEVIH